MTFRPKQFTTKEDEVARVAVAVSEPDFKNIEPHLLHLDTYLILRSYIDGYTQPIDVKIWNALRNNEVANALVKRGSLVNLARWFIFVEDSHPEIQSEFKVAICVEAVKAKQRWCKFQPGTTRYR